MSLNQIEIRPARPEEAPFLTHIAVKAKAHWGYDEDFMSRCQDELIVTAEAITASDTDHGVLALSRRLVGFYAVTHLSPVNCELEALFVLPEVMGMGLGARLIRHAIELAGEQGRHRIEIQSDPHAIGFYRKMGALLVGERESGSVAGRMLPVLEIRLTDKQNGAPRRPISEHVNNMGHLGNLKVHIDPP